MDTKSSSYLTAYNHSVAENQCSVVVLSMWFSSDKIKDLLKPGTVSTMTKLALVNAIYFKGNWKNRFDVANTKEMPFKVNKVKTMLKFDNAETKSSFKRNSLSQSHVHLNTARNSKQTLLCDLISLVVYVFPGSE